MQVVARIKGGLGNQLYCYAAARRLALVNGAELVLDAVSGFSRDHLYRRRYMLHHFPVQGRLATPAERLEPFERIRRGMLKKLQQLRPFEQRSYITQESNDFDARLLGLRLIHPFTYLDGLWQSENYFADIADLIRAELAPPSPRKAADLELAARCRETQSVAIHVRWFSAPENGQSWQNASRDYYSQALRAIECSVPSAHYLVFSDNIEAARHILALPPDRCTFVTHIESPDADIRDFWLMTQCRHFIIANSTFSWWAAWLSGTSESSRVLYPRLAARQQASWSWDHYGQMPLSWTPIQI